MAQTPPPRNILLNLVKTFLSSFRPRQFRGNLIGTDYMGNKYFEIPADPSIGKRKANRWFVPTDKEKFDQELPAEWESWLRGRRTQAPDVEEIERNLAIMAMKKQNAIAVEAKAGKMTPQTKGMESFPKLPGFEKYPGQNE